MMGGLDQSFIKAYGTPAAVMTPATVAVLDQAAPRVARAPISNSHSSPPTPHARFGAAAPQNSPVAPTTSPVIQHVAGALASSWAVSFSTFDAPFESDIATVTTQPAVKQPIRPPSLEPAPPRPHIFQSAATFQPEPIRPLLEVEQFLWPDLIGDLHKRVAGPLRELAAEFSAASAGGCRVLLFVGGQRGCGATSLLLATARQLAQHGLRAVLADANFARPDLAAYLGIAAQVGWEDVMTRQSSLADALVESTADQLTLLPLKGPVSPQETPLDFSLAAENLRQLRHHYDLVLVDGGSLEDSATGMLLAHVGNGAVEGIVSIQDARAAREGLRLADGAARQLVDRLQIGTIENFAA